MSSAQASPGVGEPPRREEYSASDVRLAIDCREFVPGRVTGIGRFLGGILEEIVRNRPRIATIAMAGQTTMIPVAAPQVFVHRLPRRPTLYLDQALLPRALRETKATVFFSPYYKAPLAAPCPTVVTIHDLIPVTFPAYTRGWRQGFAIAFRLWATLLGRRATAVVTDSEYSKREVADRLGIPAARIHVMPIGVGREFHPDHQPEDIRSTVARYGIGGPYLLAVGNFLPHKNLSRLVEAHALLPTSERARMALVLAGSPAGHGPAHTPDRRTFARDGVIMPGFIAPEDLPRLYAGAPALVCASLAEGFGLPVVEAMACGTPVACARAGALPEVAGDAALYFDPTSAADMAAALRRITADETLRGTLRAHGLSRARDFDPRKTTARLVDLLETIAVTSGAS
jgi:alpha-1,3-rhamnosyl/mannosyltransferase